MGESLNKELASRSYSCSTSFPGSSLQMKKRKDSGNEVDSFPNRAVFFTRRETVL